MPHKKLQSNVSMEENENPTFSVNCQQLAQAKAMRWPFLQKPSLWIPF